MAPKTQFTKNQILETALELVKTRGFKALSVRQLAKQLGCSVAPIYANFNHMDDLTLSVQKELEHIVWSYTSKPYTNLGFYNIGIGQILFAKDHPVLYQELLIHTPGSFTPDDAILEKMVGLMLLDPILKDLSVSTLINLLRTMALLTAGMCLEMIQSGPPYQFQPYLTLLAETGSHLIYAYQNESQSTLMTKIEWYETPQ